jgi:hypothetical protein
MVHYDNLSSIGVRRSKTAWRRRGFINLRQCNHHARYLPTYIFASGVILLLTWKVEVKLLQVLKASRKANYS